jgi:NAD(P)-dependent dehydrogenase (short-subunit alcohol dehydrogenase family)
MNEEGSIMITQQAKGPATDVVIGAGSGMGEAVARRLAVDSDRLLLADIDAGAAERVASELGGDVQVCHCDITSRGDLEAIAATTGPVRRLVLTAGLSPTMAAGRRVLEVDLVGPALLLDVFGSQAGSGAVALLFSSMAGHFVPPAVEIDAVLDRPLAPTLLDDLKSAGVDVDEPGTAYGYAKRGLLRLVRREAHSWGQRGARLLSLSPGIIDTPMGRRENAAQPVMEEMVTGSPLGRSIEADEVAVVATFLLSRAASAMTGTDVLVDGGVVAAITG